jgi:para-aminobenzoate synthetase/4-amino-4-deoxychorismate lyase
MKGTLPRGLTFSKDRKNAETLQNSPKDRAENIMIVDMLRNDIGRVADAGSVETLSRFDVEKYPTVWQMTSAVQGTLSQRRKGATNTELVDGELSAFAPLREIKNIFKALFPCASITGAPKAKTMEIIQGLEASPRGIYTGSIGFIAPNGDAQFNVAIRTAVIQDGKAEYGIGGGIVWDSDAKSEYEEAISKAAILTKRMPDFQCLETMLWEDGEILLLERHLKRLAESAEYFDFKCDFEKIREHLRNLRLKAPTRIRLLLSKDGRFETQTFEIKRDEGVASTLAVAKEPIDSTDVFLYHKTTNREVYETAKANFPDADDVLLYNERDEVTESCIANIVVELDGRKVTPPVSCGLLAGTFRDELLENGEIEERVITLDDLKCADSICLINSVRKWREVTLN